MDSAKPLALKARIGEFAEHTTESACACAVMMVQGQLLMLSAAHWIVALETGFISGFIATVLIMLGRATRPWVISVIVGIVTTTVDFLIHSGDFVPVLVEALLTGLGAALLALLLTTIIRFFYRKRQVQSESAKPDTL